MITTGAALGKARAHDIKRALSHYRGRGCHDHHGRFGLGCERRDSQRDRGESKAGKNIHLAADQKLLGNAPAVVGNARIIAQDELDFPAINARAVLPHIEAGARLPVVVNAPVIGRMRPILTVSSATALTEANAMDAPAINLHNIAPSSHYFKISHKPS
jgi:hypothetical protein